jgi:hypothetical protein
MTKKIEYFREKITRWETSTEGESTIGIPPRRIRHQDWLQ